MPHGWIVVLEVTHASPDQFFEVEVVQRVLHLLADHQAAGLHSPDRYVLQLRVEADSSAGALEAALGAWRRARGAVAAARGDLVRAEVLTLEEFESECEPTWVGRFGDPIVGWAQQPPATEAGHQLLHRALHDSATGLPNAGLFRAHVEQALHGHQAAGALAVMQLDLDGFGEVIRRWGRSVAEAAQRDVAARLVAALADTDTVARLGTGQFAALVLRHEGAAVAESARAVVEAIRQPVEHRGFSLHLTASVGTAIALPGASASQLMKAAALAVATAKAAGGDRHEPYPHGLDDAALDHLETEIPDPFDESAFLGLLEEAARVASGSATLEAASRLVIQQLCAHTGWPMGVLYVVDEETGELVPATEWHASTVSRCLEPFVAATMRASFPRGIGLPGRVLESGRAEGMADVGSEPEFLRAEAARTSGIRAGVAVPIRVGSKVAAVLEFLSREPSLPDEAGLAALASLATQLGRVVERTQAEAALRVSEAQLREAITLARLGRWRADLRTLEVEWSPELDDLLGQPSSAVPRSADALLAVVHPDDRPMVEAQMLEVLASGRPGPFLELRVVRPDGQIRWVLTRAAVLTVEDGASVVLHGIAQDITARMQLEEQLRVSEARRLRAEALLARGVADQRPHVGNHGSDRPDA